MEIDFGLSVTFDGKNYTLMVPDHVKEYPIGGLICEYCRLSPTEIKDVIISLSGLNNEVTPDKVISTHMQFHQKLLETFPPVTATMISLEFLHGLEDWMKAIRENRTDEYINDFFEIKENDKIKEFILDDTPYTKFGCNDIFQIMLSSYYGFAMNYKNVKYMFNQILGKDGDSEQRDKVLDLYSDMYVNLIDMQHIDFRIMCTIENGLESLYTIKSSVSLLLFEMAHCLQEDKQILVCSNCNEAFVPEGRCDTIYCSYPSPQNKNKTCREIGAQVARSNKEKTDIVTREYRKVYMRYKMMTKRHPEDRSKKKLFEELTHGIKEWRKGLSDGTKTTEEFLLWLEQF